MGQIQRIRHRNDYYQNWKVSFSKNYSFVIIFILQIHIFLMQKIQQLSIPFQKSKKKKKI